MASYATPGGESSSASATVVVENERERPTSSEQPAGPILNNEELRIVLVGKTGAGKSATGNTILGRQKFKSYSSFISVTESCDKNRGVVNGQNVAVVDTPGLFDNRFEHDKTIKEIKQCLCFASPGPHVFLVVIKMGRFTEEEKKTVEMIQEVFGVQASKYTMVLLTNGDQLDSQSIEPHLQACPDLQGLIYKLNSRYHVFNNKDNDRSQVTELLQKINKMVNENGGSHYTTDMFQQAERAIEEEKQRILKEREQEIRRQEEDKKKKFELELKTALEEEKKELQRKHEEEFKRIRENEDKIAREQAERQNKFIGCGAAIGAVPGLVAGAGIGAVVGGPVGAVVGGIIGGVGGTVAGAVTGCITS